LIRTVEYVQMYARGVEIGRFRWAASIPAKK
jgi:hypothetical protein